MPEVILQAESLFKRLRSSRLGKKVSDVFRGAIAEELSEKPVSLKELKTIMTEAGLTPETVEESLDFVNYFESQFMIEDEDKRMPYHLQTREIQSLIDLAKLVLRPMTLFCMVSKTLSFEPYVAQNYSKHGDPPIKLTCTLLNKIVQTDGCVEVLNRINTIPNILSQKISPFWFRDSTSESDSEINILALAELGPNNPALSQDNIEKLRKLLGINNQPEDSYGGILIPMPTLKNLLLVSNDKQLADIFSSIYTPIKRYSFVHNGVLEVHKINQLCDALFWVKENCSFLLQLDKYGFDITTNIFDRIKDQYSSEWKNITFSNKDELIDFLMSHKVQIAKEVLIEVANSANDQIYCQNQATLFETLGVRLEPFKSRSRTSGEIVNRIIDLADPEDFKKACLLIKIFGKNIAFNQYTLTVSGQSLATDYVEILTYLKPFSVADLNTLIEAQITPDLTFMGLTRHDTDLLILKYTFGNSTDIRDVMARIEFFSSEKFKNTLSELSFIYDTSDLNNESQKLLFNLIGKSQKSLEEIKASLELVLEKLSVLKYIFQFFDKNKELIFRKIESFDDLIWLSQVDINLMEQALSWIKDNIEMLRENASSLNNHLSFNVFQLKKIYQISQLPQTEIDRMNKIVVNKKYNALAVLLLEHDELVVTMRDFQNFVQYYQFIEEMIEKYEYRFRSSDASVLPEIYEQKDLIQADMAEIRSKIPDYRYQVPENPTRFGFSPYSSLSPDQAVGVVGSDQSRMKKLIQAMVSPMGFSEYFYRTAEELLAEDSINKIQFIKEVLDDLGLSREQIDLIVLAIQQRLSAQMKDSIDTSQPIDKDVERFVYTVINFLIISSEQLQGKDLAECAQLIVKVPELIKQPKSYSSLIHNRKSILKLPSNVALIFEKKFRLVLNNIPADGSLDYYSPKYRNTTYDPVVSLFLSRQEELVELNQADYLDLEFFRFLGSDESVRNSGILQKLVTTLLVVDPQALSGEILEEVAGNHCLPMHIYEEFLLTHPEINATYLKLKRESEQQEWADVILNPEEFWNNSIDLLVSLNLLGYSSISFRTFRSIVNNVDAVEILRSSSINNADLIKFKNKIGLDLAKYFYVDLTTLTTIKPMLDEPEAEPVIAFYKQLLAENPRSFKNAVASIKANPEIDIANSSIQESIKSVIRELGNITPIVLKEYVLITDVRTRIEFIDKIKKFKQSLLKNEPIKTQFQDQGISSEVLSELITLSFPGTSLSNVIVTMNELGDRCDDLAELQIQEDGYSAHIETKAKVISLKKNQELDRSFLEELRNMFPRTLNGSIRERMAGELRKSIVSLIRSGGIITYEQIKSEFPSLISILYENEAVFGFRKTNFDFSQQENVSVFLGRVTELLGVYFKDNFEQALAKIIEEDAEMQKQLNDLLNPKRVEQIRKNNGKLPERQLAILEEIISQINACHENNEPISAKIISELITLLIENKILAGPNSIRSKIKKEADKFEYKDQSGELVAGENIDFKGYVSKNVASFFAKTTAGVCTAGDTALFNRPDHFHINLVQNEMVIGNIQGYIFEYQGKKTFIFRGFNPSSSVLNRTNVGLYCEGMMNIVKTFARDNQVSEIFIPEQTVWHALTNRVGEGVYDYFKDRYLKPENEVEYKYDITDSASVNKLYRIPI